MYKSHCPSISFPAASTNPARFFIHFSTSSHHSQVPAHKLGLAPPQPITMPGHIILHAGNASASYVSCLLQPWSFSLAFIIAFMQPFHFNFYTPLDQSVAHTSAARMPFLFESPKQTSTRFKHDSAPQTRTAVRKRSIEKLCVVFRRLGTNWTSVYPPLRCKSRAMLSRNGWRNIVIDLELSTRTWADKGGMYSTWTNLCILNVLGLRAMGLYHQAAASFDHRASRVMVFIRAAKLDVSVRRHPTSAGSITVLPELTMQILSISKGS